MQFYEAKNIINDVFESGFDKGKFVIFIKNLLKDFEEKPFGRGAYQGGTIPKAFQSVISRMERLGKFIDSEDNEIDILIVKLHRRHSVEYARTTQRNFIRWYLNGSRGGVLKDAALVAFYTENSPDWRFSLIKMQYSLKKGKDEFTPAKRLSFLVGEQGKTHTAQQQLVPLLQKDEMPTLDDLEEAFNIETVSDEFFERYKTQLFNLKDRIDKIARRDKIVRDEFKEKNIDTLNFAKKLLGQIVFLYFLQRKGWLGLDEGQKYGEGDRNFMRHLFEKAKTKKENFFNDYLEFLFYDALSKKRTTDFYRKFNCRIPFLNGGLFDPIKFYDWRKTDIVIPNDIFSNRNDDDEGTGILDTFDLYNFTIKEDEPLEKEVAIDPEMLGKVFERMLDVTERKGKGAFYTPREIVHYMAQQSLVYYLETEFEGKIAKQDFETFIHYGENIIDKDIAIYEGKLKETANDYDIPADIRNNAAAIDKALEDIKILDPAVGSGAFPVGVMNEIVKLRTLLTPFIVSKTSGLSAEVSKKYALHNQDDWNTKRKRRTYLFKANAIQNSIYGVDIDAGAVEIAKLRLWLSLVVDEDRIDNIEPLPNLDYKIVRGNSLIGIPDGVMYNLEIRDIINEMMDEYYNITDKREKQKLKKNIDKKIDELLQSIYDDYQIDINFDFRLFFHEVFNEKNGFDIVIGNPPYVQLQKAFDSTRKYADLYKNLGFETFARTGDIYALFIEKGIMLLHESGLLTFITSNKWMRAAYGESLRRFLAKFNPLVIIDLGPGVFSSATVDTDIIIIKKEKTAKKNTKALTLTADKDIAALTDDDFVTLDELGEDSWIILKPEEKKIKQKIERIGTPLKDWDINIYRGVLTGYNEAFIIDGATKDRLIAEDPKSAEIIKPILRGRDIKRYKADFADLWLINTHNGYTNSNGQYIHPIEVNKYPAIKKHLDKYWNKLKKRQDKGVTPYNLRNCAYIEEFEKEKIVYQELTQGSSFSLDYLGNTFVTNTAYLITGKDLKYLLSILNTKLIELFFAKNISVSLGGKGIRWLNQYIQILPIPKIPKSEQKPFEKLVDRIIKKKEQGEDTAAEELQIDIMVYKLYGLTYAEVKTVDPAFPLTKKEYEEA